MQKEFLTYFQNLLGKYLIFNPLNILKSFYRFDSDEDTEGAEGSVLTKTRANAGIDAGHVLGL